MSGGSNTNPGSLQVSKGQVVFMRSYILASHTVTRMTYGGGLTTPFIGRTTTYNAPHAVSGSPPIPSVAQSAMVDTNNLPNLQWIIWVNTRYTYWDTTVVNPLTGSPPGPVTFFPQNNISFVPIVSEGSFTQAPTLPPPWILPGEPDPAQAGAVPLRAPIVLPIGVPLTINITAATTSMGCYFMLPVTANVPPAIAQFGTYSQVHVVLSASA